MARLKLVDSDICWRCERSRGTLMHMLYDCQMTTNLWKDIITFVNKVLRADLIQNPAPCILGIIPAGLDQCLPCVCILLLFFFLLFFRSFVVISLVFV
uniref:Uncharacterized protein n=1 Tax=Sander lucioperca TaxID=283035 RepID=A0A8C9X0Z3_SANLU